jgi:urease accessory protein
MQLAEPLGTNWKASLGLRFSFSGGKTTLVENKSEGPLVVQKPLYPEGPGVCHAIVVHPPGGIAGGDELTLDVDGGPGAKALLTTPGAAKWYRTRGPIAKQQLAFRVEGSLEWLPRETIVFDGASAELDCRVDLAADGMFVGWEVLCLGRRGSGERFARGTVRLMMEVKREGKLLFVERGTIDGNGALMHSPVGFGGCSVLGTMLVSRDMEKPKIDSLSATRLPGVLVARYLGDSSEEALGAFGRLWAQIRPAVLGRGAVEPRIWRT